MSRGNKLIAAVRALGRNPFGSASRAVRAARTFASGAKSVYSAGKAIYGRAKPMIRAVGKGVMRGYRAISKIKFGFKRGRNRKYSGSAKSPTVIRKRYRFHSFSRKR